MAEFLPLSSISFLAGWTCDTCAQHVVPGEKCPNPSPSYGSCIPQQSNGRLDVFYLVGGVCTGPTGGSRTNGDKSLARENLDGMCEARLSLKMMFPGFILPTILPEKDWETVGYVFFHHCNSTPKALKPKRVWNLWSSFDTATLHAGSFLLSMGTIKTWKSNFHGKRGRWGHSYSNLIPNLRVFCCRCSYQKSQQLGMPGFPFGDWCLLCGWECCTLCWSHVAGPVSGGVGLCARHIQLCTTCIGRKKSY